MPIGAKPPYQDESMYSENDFSLDPDLLGRNSTKKPSAPEPEPVPFKKRWMARFTLLLILTGVWLVGQATLGIPDELLVEIFAVLLYNWFVDNGYKLPDWLPNLFKK